MERFRDRYRIPPARLQNWDYGWNALYFITICTANMFRYFGEIIDGEMRLNDSGLMAGKFWAEIPEHFTDAVLDEYVIMPNHVHGIITIDKQDDCRDAINRVSKPETNANSKSETGKQPGGITGNNNPMFYENISRIIRWYKGRVSFEMHKTVAGFNWQSRFHDHIIRDEESYKRIREYIINNPRNWKDDKPFSDY